MHKDRVTPLGVRLSAGLLTALACLFGFYTAFFSLLFVILFRRSHNSTSGWERTLVGLTATIVGTAGLSFLGFRAASALRQFRKKWARYVAIALGLVLLYFGGQIILDLFRPYRPGEIQGEDFFGVLIAIPCIALGIWWCVYLNLPHVREYFDDLRGTSPANN